MASQLLLEAVVKLHAGALTRPPDGPYPSLRPSSSSSPSPQQPRRRSSLASAGVAKMRNSVDYGSRSSMDTEGDELEVLVHKGSLDSPRRSLSTGRFDDDDDGVESHARRRSHHGKNSSNYRGTRYGSLLRSTVNLSLLLGLALASFVGYWVLKFFLLRHDAYAHAVFANPLIPEGKSVEPLVQPFGLSEKPSFAAVQEHLDERLLALSAPPSTLTCPWTTADAHKYSDLPSQGPYFFALNLYNNQAVLPTLARTLLSLADFLGPANTHISIFENGSTDNTTLVLAHFAAALTSAGVPHTIVSDARKTDWKKVDRIAQLSVYRNYALAPINGTAEGEEPFNHVVFINDVFVCPKDALELVWQRREQNAHAACAMDWRATKSWFGWLGFKSVKFYDNCTCAPSSSRLKLARNDHFADLSPAPYQGSAAPSRATCSARGSTR